MRARIFINFWRFQRAWEERSGGLVCDWTKLPGVLSGEASRAASAAGLSELSFEETRVYAGGDAGCGSDLMRWLHDVLDRQPGIRVVTAERRWRDHPVHCQACGTEHFDCPGCGGPADGTEENVTGARIATDLLGLAWEGAFDAALLVSVDQDRVPTVHHLQAKGIEVINAAWRSTGDELSAACRAFFELDPLIPILQRSQCPA